MPERVEDTVRDVMDAATADPWGLGQRNAEDAEGQGVRYPSAGQLSLAYWMNRPSRQLIVLSIFWLGQPPATTP